MTCVWFERRRLQRQLGLDDLLGGLFKQVPVFNSLLILSIQAHADAGIDDRALCCALNVSIQELTSQVLQLAFLIHAFVEGLETDVVTDVPCLVLCTLLVQVKVLKVILDRVAN